MILNTGQLDLVQQSRTPYSVIIKCVVCGDDGSGIYCVCIFVLLMNGPKWAITIGHRNIWLEKGGLADLSLGFKGLSDKPTSSPVSLHF